MSAPSVECLAFIRRAEELGFGGVGIAEDLRFADPFETLVAAASETRRVWLYPAVTNPVTRDPSELAKVTNTLADQAPGRVKVALGRGDSALTGSDKRPATLAKLRDSVLELRAMLGGGSLPVSDRLPSGTPSELLPPPVLMAASGPRALEAAGQVADEVLVTSGLSLEAREAVTASIAEGAVNAGRRARSVPITYYTFVSIDDDRDTAIERARFWIYVWLNQGIFRLSLRAMGIPAPPFSTPEAIPTAFLRTLAGTLVLAGSGPEVASRVERLAAEDVTTLFCMLPSGPKQHAEALESIARHVLPVIA